MHIHTGRTRNSVIMSSAVSQIVLTRRASHKILLNIGLNFHAQIFTLSETQESGLFVKQLIFYWILVVFSWVSNRRHVQRRLKPQPIFRCGLDQGVGMRGTPTKKIKRTRLTLFQSYPPEKPK